MPNKEKKSETVGGQKEILAGYKPSQGEKMASNVGEYQKPNDPKSYNC